MRTGWNMRHVWAIIAGLLTVHTLTGIAYWLKMNPTALATHPNDVELIDAYGTPLAGLIVGAAIWLWPTRRKPPKQWYE